MYLYPYNTVPHYTLILIVSKILNTSTTYFFIFYFLLFLVLYIMSNVNVSTYSIYGVTLSLIYHIQPAGTRSNELKLGILI